MRTFGKERNTIKYNLKDGKEKGAPLSWVTVSDKKIFTASRFCL